jgi:hypothetical protein
LKERSSRRYKGKGDGGGERERERREGMRRHVVYKN